MSKRTKRALSSTSSGIHSADDVSEELADKAEKEAGAVVNAMAINETVCSVEIKSNLSRASETIRKAVVEYSKVYDEMVKTEVEIVNKTKVLTQKSKDYANQLGEALARIDKVMVKDFEAKLLLLERFVVASQELAELEKSGALQKIAGYFK